MKHLSGMGLANGFFILVGIAIAAHIIFSEVKYLASPSTPEQQDVR